MMTVEKNQKFDDLAAISIYHLTDVCYKQRATEAHKRLLADGTISESDLEKSEMAWEAYSQYEALVSEYAQELLPEGYTLQHDYWGAKGFSQNTGWNAPKQSFFAGDGQGELMMFDSYEAMVEYGEGVLEEIEAGNHR